MNNDDFFLNKIECREIHRSKGHTKNTESQTLIEFIRRTKKGFEREIYHSVEKCIVEVE